MFEVPDESVPAGTIVQVLQGGFMIGERILRPALVGVSKGGPKRAAEPAQSENAPSRS
jgi:molecular chaperone GrpE